MNIKTLMNHFGMNHHPGLQPLTKQQLKAALLVLIYQQAQNSSKYLQDLKLLIKKHLTPSIGLEDQD